MIKNYFTMKKNEWKLKGMVYGIIATFIDNQKEVLALLQKMYIALKDVSTKDLQNEFIGKLAEIIHESESFGSGTQ